MPYLLSEKRPPGSFRYGVHEGIFSDIDRRVPSTGMLIHKKIVVAAGNIQEIIKTFCL